MSEFTAKAEILMVHDVGLHARPSVKLTKLAKTFAAAIELSVTDETWIDAKSIVKVMAMKAPKDTVLHFRAAGDDAEDAVSALVALVERDFYDGPTRNSPAKGGVDVPSAG
jgi:phosphocarrier protein